MILRDQKNDKIRKDILDASLELVLSDGFESLSMRKISKKLNCTTGVVYYYFKNKQEIVEEMQRIQSEYIDEIVRSKVSEDESFEYNLRVVFYTMTMLALNEPIKYNLITLNRHQIGSKVDYTYLNALTKFLNLAIKRKELKEIDVESTAFAIWSSFVGFNLNISMHKDIAIEEVDKLFEAQFNMIMNGIKLG